MRPGDLGGGRNTRLLEVAVLAGTRSQPDGIGWTFPPGERAGHDRAVAAVRNALGSEEYERVSRLGALMTLDQAVAYAMCDEA